MIKTIKLVLMMFILIAIGAYAAVYVFAEQVSNPSKIVVSDTSSQTTIQCISNTFGSNSSIDKPKLQIPPPPKGPVIPDPKVIKRLMEEYNLSIYAFNTEGMEPATVNRLLREFKALGIKVTTDPSITSSFSCDVLYSGRVYVLDWDVYWFGKYCDGSTYSCSRTRPSEIEACDIHYEDDMYFRNQFRITRGLIDFPGCRPAKNCRQNNNEYCGWVNTLYQGNCGLKYSDIPWGPGFWMDAEYMLPKNPCPHGDCSGKDPNQYPQVMILNIHGFP